MPNPVLHHVTVVVHPERLSYSLDFYRDVLGLKMIMSPVRYSAWFEQGVHLYWGPPGSEEHFVPDNDPPPQHFAIVVGDRYDEIVAVCVQRAWFLSKGTEYWGSKRCFIKDPSNNRIEIMERAP